MPSILDMNSKTSLSRESRPKKGVSVQDFIDLNPPSDPPVTYLEMLRFALWAICIVLIQALRDLKARRIYRPNLSTDLATHYFYIPVGRMDPRLVLTAPQDRMLVRIIPEWVTKQYEELENLDQCPTRVIVNAASNNYGGFCLLEHNSSDLVETALRNLPFAPAPPALENLVREEYAAYMNGDACITTPSGFSANVLAFATIVTTAEADGRNCVFLCDQDCHNSMFTGAFMNKRARVHKFKHNDIGDLEYKLRTYRERDPQALICVAVEGIYSMEGSISPGPAILALKRVFRFTLLMDEAHSFMALGSRGRGSLEHWQDKGYDCPLSEVDIMSCMFSKSVGCTGGFVIANGVYAAELEKQGEMMQKQSMETLSTVVLVRVLSLLRKPLLIESRMRQLRSKATYVAERLSEAGCRILSSPGSAIICFPVGTVRQVANFHREALKLGFAIVGGVPPATPLWGCRVRMCIFANTSWDDIYRLINVTVSICQNIKVYGVHGIKFDSTSLPAEEKESISLRGQSEQVDATLEAYLMSLRASKTDNKAELCFIDGDEVISAGAIALRKYGIGPCSARWFYGSFDIFVSLEQRLAKLYPSLVYQSGRCRAMICGDAEITIGSTFTACAVPHVSKGVTNLVLVPNDAPLTVKKGVSVHRPTPEVQVLLYDTLNDIATQIKKLDGGKYHISSYLQTVRDGNILDLSSAIRNITSNIDCEELNGFTIMLDDRNGLGKIGPRYLGYLDLMESKHGENFFEHALGPIAHKTTVLVAGSWYDAFGHQGGYVTGDATAVESLTWNAKAFFFSTPPMPLQAAMSNKALELLAECNQSGVKQKVTRSSSSASSSPDSSSPQTPQAVCWDSRLHTSTPILSLPQDIKRDEDGEGQIVFPSYDDIGYSRQVVDLEPQSSPYTNGS